MNKNIIILIAMLMLLAGCAQTNKDIEQEVISPQQSTNTPQSNENLVTSDESSVDNSIDVVEKISIYTLDDNTMESIIVDEIVINSNLMTTMQSVANSLSSNIFWDLDIEVLEIVEVDGKEIAYIDLQENETSQFTWNQLFQGSTGGEITSQSLELTFLQRDYEGEWVEGIFITHEREALDYDHVPRLNDIIFR